MWINASQASSSDAYSKVAVEAFFQSMTKEHQVNLDKANQVVSDSTAMCKEVLEKVEKLIFNAQTFMMTLQTASETNTSKANEAIVGLRTSLQTEKEARV